MSLAEKVRDFKSGPGLIDQHIDQMAEVLADVPKDELIKRFASLDLAKLLLYYRDSYDLNENVGMGGAHAQRNKKRQ